MTITQINTGTQPNDGTGDSLRQAFIKTNNNFTELDSKVTLSAQPSPRIGEFFFAKSGLEVQGVIEVKPQRITNGAVDYPIWASMYPEFISGDDILFPSNVQGMFLRNNGGQASTEGSSQSDATARPNNNFTTSSSGSHSHTFSDTRLSYVNLVSGYDTTEGLSIPSSGTSSRARINESGAEGIRFTNSNDSQSTVSAGSHEHSISGGDSETRPHNRAYQLYTIVDSYNYSEINVVNTKDVVVNDQASSGYIDIGSIRMQWGIDGQAGQSRVVTFPVPFASAPVVTLTADQNSVGIANLDSGPSTTSFSFTIRNISSAAINSTTHWQAIGLKPE